MLFCCEAPEIFCRLWNLTDFPSAWDNDWSMIFFFWVILSFKAWRAICFLLQQHWQRQATQHHSTSQLYSTTQPTASLLLRGSRDMLLDTTQLWIHFGTTELIQDRNVNKCLETGHIIRSRTEGSLCPQHLDDNADTTLYVNHPCFIYRYRPHSQETQGGMRANMSGKRETACRESLDSNLWSVWGYMCVCV